MSEAMTWKCKAAARLWILPSTLFSAVVFPPASINSVKQIAVVLQGKANELPQNMPRTAQTSRTINGLKELFKEEDVKRSWQKYSKMVSAEGVIWFRR